MVAVHKEHQSGLPDSNKVPLIMVVDDEPNICMVLQRILESQGFRVVIAFDGRTALRLIVKQPPDLILMDIMMPGMDGRELCSRVHDISDCRIIYLSGRTDLALSGNELPVNERADAFIPKPATMKHIISVIDSTLAGHQPV